MVKTVRTVTQVVERDETVKAQPEFKIGDYLEVYSGPDEGHNFWVKDVRWNHDRKTFEYLYDGVLMGGWKPEANVVRA